MDGAVIGGIGLVVAILLPVYGLMGLGIWWGLLALLWVLTRVADASARLGDRIFGPRHKPKPAPEPVVFKDDLNAIDPIELDHWEPASRFEVSLQDDYFGPPRRRRRRSRGRGRF
jgi:hypothetical protein